METPNINAFVDMIKKSRKTLDEKWTEILDAIQTIFDDIPDLKIIIAEGYAPWFNDGEPCVWTLSVKVDELGDALYHHGGLDEDIENRQMQKFSNDLSACLAYTRGKSIPNESLSNAYDLLHLLDFEDFDEHNGTAWAFVRNDNDSIGSGYSFAVDTERIVHE